MSIERKRGARHNSPFNLLLPTPRSRRRYCMSISLILLFQDAQPLVLDAITTRILSPRLITALPSMSDSTVASYRTSTPLLDLRVIRFLASSK